MVTPAVIYGMADPKTCQTSFAMIYSIPFLRGRSHTSGSLLSRGAFVGAVRLFQRFPLAIQRHITDFLSS